MAKREKKDMGLNATLDQIERKIFQLKIQYEKYFSGIESLEPVREFDALQKQFRDLMTRRITNTQQRYRLTQLKARFSSLNMYWKRNLILIERGTHPKQKFRASLKERQQREAELMRQLQKEKQAQRRRQTEGTGYRSVYDQLIEARRKTGQATNISFDSIQSTLQKQEKAIKAQYGCDSVRFKVSIQDGKAKMKAVPVRNEKK